MACLSEVRLMEAKLQKEYGCDELRAKIEDGTATLEDVRTLWIKEMLAEMDAPVIVEAT